MMLHHTTDYFPNTMSEPLIMACVEQNNTTSGDHLNCFRMDSLLLGTVIEV